MSVLYYKECCIFMKVHHCLSLFLSLSLSLSLSIYIYIYIYRYRYRYIDVYVCVCCRYMPVRSCVCVDTRVHMLMLYRKLYSYKSTIHFRISIVEYDTKQSDDEVPVMLGLCWSGAPLHCHCSQVHWPGMVTPDKGLI